MARGERPLLLARDAKVLRRILGSGLLVALTGGADCRGGGDDGAIASVSSDTLSVNLDPSDARESSTLLFSGTMAADETISTPAAAELSICAEITQFSTSLRIDFACSFSDGSSQSVEIGVGSSDDRAPRVPEYGCLHQFTDPDTHPLPFEATCVLTLVEGGAQELILLEVDATFELTWFDNEKAGIAMVEAMKA